MADIFLSYATEDRKIAARLVDTFARTGWSVFWDRATPVGKSWDRVLEEQLAAAGAITALWSPNSVTSDWVLIEATEGMERKKLFPALIAKEEETHVPIRFKLTEYADLSDWDGNSDHDGWSRLVAALSEHLKSGKSRGVERAVEPEHKYRRRRERHDVFLGYARPDHSIAKAVADALEDAGVAVWYDRAIVVGESFQETIMSALQSARAVIILWTDSGVQSEWVKAEAQFAMSLGILIGVKADGVSLPPQFANTPVLDLTTSDGESLGPQLNRLLDSLAPFGIRARTSSTRSKERNAALGRSERPGRFTWIRIVLTALIAGAAGAVILFFIQRGFGK